MYPQQDATDRYGSDWSGAVSHEFAEMLVDPWLNRYIDGQLVEVCDPLERQPTSYTVGPVWLNVSVVDFVTPQWFTGAPGWRDEEHVLPRNR